MQFKQLLLVTYFSLFVIINYGCDVNNSAETDAKNTFDERTFIVKVPQNYTESKEYSLLFIFHGAGGTGAGIRSLAKFNSYASAKDIIICYPDALVENWEEGCKCNKPHRLGIDDVGYVTYLINKFTSEYNIDTTKIFGVGFSQGGLFALNLACKLSNIFAAIATVASPMSVPLYNNCVPSQNVSIMMIHGTKDGVLPFYGTQQGSFSLVSTPKAAQRWGSLNGCFSTPEITEIVKGGENTIGVIKHEYHSCNSDSKVILFEIVNGVHTWFATQEFQATNEIINFFYPL